MTQMTTPNFFIIGAAKSGTTSLDRYLAQHPDIYMAPAKETHYYAAHAMPKFFSGPGDETFSKNLIRNEADYKRLFMGVRTEKAIGESSVYYLYYPGTAERIARAVPNAKIIVVLRNPVDRAFSAYMHLVRDGRETLSFEDGLAAEENRKRNNFQPLWLYQEVGHYVAQLQRYLEIFGQKRVFVVSYSEFDANPRKVLARVFDFLGVDSNVSIDTSIRYNATGVPVAGLYHLATESNRFTQWLKPLVSARVRERLRFGAKNLSMKHKSMRVDLRKQLERNFADEVSSIEEILSCRLTDWG